MPILPRTVIVLGIVSFLNDTASEMITPLLPIFVTATLGAGPAFLGLIEGLAEATASVLKYFSGRLNDLGWNPKHLVIGGYSISNISRPLIGFALGWGWVLLLRFLDRVGKGIRTSPRDALIAASTSSSHRGLAFGFHRALDNAGAMLGPLLAFLLLHLDYSVEQVFVWSVVPGILVVLLLIFGLPGEAPKIRPETPPPLKWQKLDRRLRGMILASGGLALASAPEVFLVLWATDRGLAIAWVPLVWAAASAVKAVVAAPAGILSDRLGRFPVLLGGWALRILLLVILALSYQKDSGSSAILTWLIFLCYAAALASTEGAERALIGDFARHQERGTAFGLYHMVTGLAALPGALLFGTIWQVWNAEAAFMLAALLAAISILFLAREVWQVRHER